MKRLLIISLLALAGCRDTDTTVVYFTMPKDSAKTCYYVNQYHVCEAKPAAMKRPTIPAWVDTIPVGINPPLPPVIR